MKPGATPAPDGLDSPHALPAGEVLKRLGVAASAGLAEASIQERRRQYGANTIAVARGPDTLRILLHQFAGPVVYLLGAAAALAAAMGDLEEAVAICAVLGLNALIGFSTELKAARSIQALRALGAHTARVRRESGVRVVAAEELVPGDIVLLDAGDAVPADTRLVEASHLAADESTLTGESVAVDKHVAPVSQDARIGDRACMLFRGTAVTRGSGVGVVVATGLGTQLGQVTQLVIEADPGSSPLERKLARLSTQLVWATLAIAAVIGVIGWMGDDPLLAVQSAIALAVAAIPEGLPIVATLALARGMWRMARQNALIERLAAVETLGATTVVLTDKTGTLTENRMAVRRLWTASGEIETQPAAPAPDVRRRFTDDREATELLRIAVLCNDAHLEHAGEGGSGDPMEIALLRAGLQAGMKPAALRQGHRTVRKHAFDTATKMMATVHESGDGFLFAVKGAPEAVLAAATRARLQHGDTAMDDALRSEWLDRARRLAWHGLRVLACAMKMDTEPDRAPYEGLVFLGLVGLEDPARADVPQAIRTCRAAGIRVVMVTGDHAATARSIGKAVGLDADASRVVEGKEVAGVIGAGRTALHEAVIYARVNPAEKLALVKAYQQAGDVVAMTGDGVNDAPALRQADIGVAMGLRGTDVAREAAAMVLLDDSFSTIVSAIREGRIIFGNIRRFLMYLLSCNASEVIVVGLAVLLPVPLPLLPLQILYLNLVTDVFPGLALAMGEGDPGVLDRAPRDPKEALLTRSHWLQIGLHAAALAAATFAALAAAYALGLGARQMVTASFLTLAFAQLWHALNMRDARSGLVSNEVTRNPWLWGALALCTALLVVPLQVPAMANLLQLVPLTATMWWIVLGCSLLPLLTGQAGLVAARLRRVGRGAARGRRREA